MDRRPIAPPSCLALLVSLVVLALATPAFEARAAAPQKIADEVVETIASPSPYPGADAAGADTAGADTAGADTAGAVVWRRSLHVPGASYIAVHFASFDLAPGDELVLRDPEGLYRHAYRGRGLQDRGGDFWGLSVLGASMEIELRAAGPGPRAGGVVIDRWAHGYPLDAADGTEALCGPEDFRDVECYTSTYPTEYERSRAVVRLIKNGSAHCTGWLASCENHIVTNEHCVGSQSELGTIEFQFDYKRPACNSGTPTVALQLQGGTLLEVDPPLDYALIMPALAGGDPQATYGFLKWDVRLPGAGEPMYIPGHPSGDPKRLSVDSTHPEDQSGRCEVYSVTEPACASGGPPDVGYYCDTEGGSSGSPVLSAVSHEVIALHHCADCPNRGVPITEVYADIQASAHPLPACSTCAPAGVPQDLVATSPADNEVLLDWTPVADAVGYAVYRSLESCEAGMTKIAEPAAPPFVDHDVSAGVVYYYAVTARSACGAESARSNCAQGTPGGICTAPPRFAGAAWARSAGTAGCGAEVGWEKGLGLCGALRYNVYRSTRPDVVAAPGNLVASCLPASATSFVDTHVLEGETYYYLVRAEDDSGNGTGLCAAGNVEANPVVRPAIPAGPQQVLASWTFEPPASKWPLTGEWQIDAPRGRGGAADGGQGGPDPTAAAGGANVLGLDLTGLGASPGNYENNLAAPQVVASPAFSAAGKPRVFVRFARWLGVDRAPLDRATVQVYDGASWFEVWANPEQPVYDTGWVAMEIDVSSRLANKPAARVGFGHTSNGSGTGCGWNIDNLEITSPTACTSAEPALPPVPDGHFAPGAPLTATRAAGENVTVRFDASRCGSPQYALFHGDSDGLPAFAYDGAVCALGTSGEATVAIPRPAPGHATFWVVAGVGGTTEGPHGYDHAGARRAADASGLCGITAQTSAAACD